MSSRNKLYKFSQNLTYPHVVQNFESGKATLIGAGHKEVHRKGCWSQAQFQNDNPITLELACGRGEYTLELARRFPDRNFVGVDVKGARIYQGAKTVSEEGLINAAFLRTRIEFLHLFFDPEEVDEIWITFPDPFLRGNENNRLTSPSFLEQYRTILKGEGRLHLKTDEPILYEYSFEHIESSPYFEIIEQSGDLYNQADLPEEWKIRTHYENLHIASGDQICRISCYKIPREETSYQLPA